MTAPLPVADVLARLPRVLRCTALDHLQGVDMRARLTQRTFRRHRAELLRVGIDIADRATGCAQSVAPEAGATAPDPAVLEPSPLTKPLHPWPPQSRAQARAWLSEHDVMQHALAAFRTVLQWWDAELAAHPEIAAKDGPKQFEIEADQLPAAILDELEARLAAHAHRQGMPGMAWGEERLRHIQESIQEYMDAAAKLRDLQAPGGPRPRVWGTAP